VSSLWTKLLIGMFFFSVESLVGLETFSYDVVRGVLEMLDVARPFVTSAAGESCRVSRSGASGNFQMSVDIVI
jgi:hypothetical protein